MEIFSRLKTGFGLARRSGRVLRVYPKLLALPLVGGIPPSPSSRPCSGVWVYAPIFQDPSPALFGVLFVAYLVESSLPLSNAALVAATRTTFHGEEPAIRAALAAAWQRKLPLLAWSLVAAVIGMLMRAIESQENIVARLLAGVFAVVWSVMIYFVVPVIVFREPSVTGIFKASASNSKTLGGESIDR